MCVDVDVVVVVYCVLCIVSLLFNACDVITQLAPDAPASDCSHAGPHSSTQHAHKPSVLMGFDEQWPSHGVRTRAAHSALSRSFLLRETESVLLKLLHPAHLKKEVDHSSRHFLLRGRLRPARARVATAGR